MVSSPNKVVFPKRFFVVTYYVWGNVFTLWAICQKNVMEKDWIREHF